MRVQRSYLSIAMFVALSHATLAQNWKDSLKTQLSTLISTTKTSADRMRVTNPGSILVIHMGGISASPGKEGTYLTNHFRDGEIQQAKGLAVVLVDKKTNRDLKVGEKVYLTDLDVGDNDVAFLLAATETDQITVNGSTQQTRYKASIKFEFPKNTLRTMSFDEVKRVLFKVMEPETLASAPKTVELGQSMADVESAMGKPESVLKLGTKTIYVYKAIKVTFVDGKVSDIQ